MGVDTRIGSGDHFVMYRVYKPDTKIHDQVSIKNNYLYRFRAKDVSAYNSVKNRMGNMISQNTTASIETTDILKDFGIHYMLYCLPERCWYIVDSFSMNSHNESQRFSSRPINTTTINIRRA